MDKLTSLRDKIEIIDAQISELLIERFKLVKGIGVLKEKKKLPIQHKDREEHILKMVKKKSKNQSMQNYLDKLFRYIFKISRNIQK